jgi:ribonuclease I
MFAAANPSFPKNAIRTSCTGGTLQDVRICFNKDTSPRACSASAGECLAPTIQVLPVK